MKTGDGVAPKVKHLVSTGDAEKYEYVSHDGISHRIVITNAEWAASGKSRLNLVRDYIQRIESNVDGSAKT